MRDKLQHIVDLSDPTAKRSLMRVISPLQGWYEITIKPRRATRTLQQNAYLWGVIYQSLVDYQKDQGVSMTTEEVHDMFRILFLRETVVNHATGEVVGETVRSTASLDIAQFALYVDQVIAWLGDTLGIVVPEPDIMHSANSRGSGGGACLGVNRGHPSPSSRNANVGVGK